MQTDTDFEQIVLKYQNLVYTICLNIVKNPHDAENCAQETFLSAFLNLGKNKDINLSDIKSWICRIAVNKSIDFARKNAKFLYTDLSEADADFSRDIRGSPESQTERGELREKINAVISCIPEKYANAVKAFYFEEMSVKEISIYYKLPEKTVETHLYRAKKLIRERWGKNAY
ncbi:MAG: sigma-70 family RNA polymerase sigma factor [Oscillospiraceae bacterium]|nr:sigma-70 family RNA polymerase sigma factor [Oscillospiraceae bacterium]